MNSLLFTTTQSVLEEEHDKLSPTALMEEAGSNKNYRHKVKGTEVLGSEQLISLGKQEPATMPLHWAP